MIAWVAAVAVLVPRAWNLERRLDVGARVRGSESELVDSLIASRLDAPFAQPAVLVMSDVPLPWEPGGAALLDTVVARVARVPGVVRVRAWRDAADTLFVVPGRRVVIVVAGLAADAEPADRVVTRLRAATAALHRAGGLRWTGQAVLNVDLREVSARDARAAERRVLPVTLGILVLGFGGVVAAGLPVLAGALVIGCALGVAGWVAHVMPLSLLLQTFVTMVGLGLGIDYALLVVARFREARAAGREAREAAGEAARHGGRTVALSAAAVAIGFVVLAVVPVTELRSVALGGIAAAAVAALFATTLLPALLALAGRHLERGRLPLPRRTASGAGWLRWGRWVTARPLPVLGVAALPLLALAAPALRLRIGLPSGSAWLPRDLESVQALHALEEAGRDGWLQAVRVLVELPPDESATRGAGWSRLSRLREVLAADPRVGAVQSFAPLEHPRPPSRLAFLGIPRDVRTAFLSADGRTALMEVVPRARTDPAALVNYVRTVRVRGTSAVGARGRVLVGGLPALRADYDAAVAGRFGLVVTLVLGGTFVALATAFRSLLIPLKAIALNLLSVGAGFGAVVLVFQEAAGCGAVFAFVPVLVFCTVFGLSMDYEVFLLARVAEGRAAGLDDGAAVAQGLAGAGPVITGAAAVMVVVFGAFALGDMIVVRMLGLALAVAVLVDATIVRVALGPALIVLAGRWNWWPGNR
jgi:RND superfamily putative drug exporter